VLAQRNKFSIWITNFYCNVKRHKARDGPVITGFAGRKLVPRVDYSAIIAPTNIYLFRDPLPSAKVALNASPL